jgi:bifunctional non-homologous end joining protein LigD
MHTKKSPRFVIHYHAASHKHYDLRLEINGVLKSWAVPKGPPLKFSEKRLAITTEDHPLSYATFKGIIPEGNYGAGIVKIWDTGTYSTIKEKDGKLVPLNQCIKDGHIEVLLQGKKLHGLYALIRTKLHQKDSWLFIKMHDKNQKKKEPKKASNTNKASAKKSKQQLKKTNKHFLTLGRTKVELTHLDKFMYPQDNLTKKDIINYYHKIAPYMIPLMKNRPVSMLRLPDGIDGESFYQKDAANYYPSWIKQVRIPKEGGHNQMVIANNRATLVYLANQACLTPHLWLSRIDKLDYPDRMIRPLLKPIKVHNYKLQQ